MQKKNNQKNIYYAKMLSTNWLMIFVAVLLFVMIFAFVFLNYQISYERSVDKNIQVQIDNIRSSKTPPTEDSLLIEYYRELSNKTDEAINRILVIVGLITGITTIFSVIFAFKAPHDIDKRVDEIKKEVESAKEAAEEAKYQARIAFALTEETPNEQLGELTILIKEYPNKPEAYIFRGNYYMDIEKYDKAITEYEVAKKFGMAQDIYYNNIGNIYHLKKEYKTAIIYLSKAIEINPYNNSSYINRGYSYRMVKEFKNAISDYEEALFLNPECFQTYIELRDLYYDLYMSEEDKGKAKEYQSKMDKYYNKAREVDPKNNYFEDSLGGN